MLLSTFAIEAMGFRLFGESEALSACFTNLIVYRIVGLAVDEPLNTSFKGEIDEQPYELSLGLTVNEACLALTGDSWTEDQGGWEKTHKSSPPYAIVRIGPSSEHTCGKGYVKTVEEEVMTYDCFPKAREELCSLEVSLLPRLISALTSALSLPGRSVTFERVDKSRVGITRDGRRIRDIRVDLSATLTVARKLSAGEVQDAMKRAIGLAGQLNSKVTRFYHLAQEERDPLRRFLYFFLSIEIQTHSTFARIDHSRSMARVVSAQGHLPVSLAAFLADQPKRWTALRDRFVWCSVCSWTSITDADVESFARLKKVRNDIAHGTITQPPAWAPTEVEELAAKILIGPEA